MENHQKYMQMAIILAKKGRGLVNPNPLVGAVIVKDDLIIGRGYHEKYGGLHAERNALVSCTQSPEGATLYVNLEPCCHTGKTPPCTEAIMQSKIARVVVGAKDPNPLVGGKGIEILRKNGITVITDVLEEECRELNEVFFHYIQNRTPYVVMKYAMTLDGKIATYSGKSQWITGELARVQVHQLRNEYKGIMIGVNTVIKDDPLLTCRIEDGRNPSRIICDTHLRTPITAKIVESASEIPTYIGTCSRDEKKMDQFRKKGCRLLPVSPKNEYLNLNDLVHQLGQEKIDGILLEGGGTLNYSALKSGIVDKLQVYIAPKIFGGATAISPVEGQGIEDPSEAFQFKDRKIKILGVDICLEYYKR
ncbi:bifunctional diaminohydroxyphosphoribosylaminopyrimidine deaminase/5-amino-6-(5-phosphoribosylamino)uracil reductase RibD [Acetobacterium paludosum]|uniref:Riboflavin biosynthesis protein RibD n=1 Tax=Acetobacterium paludosum TaxID=52693 RepID=A0A923HTT7_9FIRM|nr:bifunctional diaminohydroxyphosphoribosylaminopyrimidine deaminase/5-amino-6-(5-phosphoribosylamino)uracil reductase RibD [Acetobacterium paludosum]MBC3888494.1 bifunctional diaminohydroxyphosphoribosylaminopyrimidine deaminase/5-amino-6-(5-phosphoribosylamino)uracil reductase RibD [Acetobacterium paludosum]